MPVINFYVAGMVCSSCARRIQDKLQSSSFASHLVCVDVSFATNIVQVEYKDGSDGLNVEIERTIKSCGFTPKRMDDRPAQLKELEIELEKWKWRLLTSLCIIVPLCCMTMFSQQLGLHTSLYSSLIAVILSTGMQLHLVPFYRLSFASDGLGMNILIVLSSSLLYLATMFTSVFKFDNNHHYEMLLETNGMMIFYAILGKYLEAIAKLRTNRILLEAIPPVGNQPQVVHPDGNITTIPIGELKKGNVIQLRVGDIVQADGKILEGAAEVDESMITGEFITDPKHVGDRLVQGTRIVATDRDCILLKVTEVGNDAMLGRIQSMVVEAMQSSHSTTKTVIDMVSRYFILGILVLGVGSFVFWYTLSKSGVELPNSFWTFPESPFLSSLMIMIGVLSIACPCALTLAMPTVLLVGKTIGFSRYQILFKDPGAIEAILGIDTVIFDKTGTLTTGKIKVNELRVMNKKFTLEQLCAYIKELEQNSTHPVGKALYVYSVTRADSMVQLDNVNVHYGGIEGSLVYKGAKSHVILGNKRFIEKYIKQEYPQIIFDLIIQWETDGMSVVWIVVDEQVAGMISLTDSIRPEANKVLNRMKSLNLKVLMVTGDQMGPSLKIARNISIDYHNIYYEYNPVDKKRLVELLQARGSKVLVVGDGINDAIAMAKASVGISFGSNSIGTLNEQSCKIVVLRDNLECILITMELCREMKKKIYQNIGWASLYNIIGVPMAMGLFLPITGHFLPPIYGSLMMALSSVSVMASSLLITNWSYDLEKDPKNDKHSMERQKDEHEQNLL